MSNTTVPYVRCLPLALHSWSLTAPDYRILGLTGPRYAIARIVYQIIGYSSRHSDHALIGTYMEQPMYLPHTEYLFTVCREMSVDSLRLDLSTPYWT